MVVEFAAKPDFRINLLKLEHDPPEPRLLLHPGIPPALHGLSPRTIMGTTWWDNVRRATYRRYNYRCWACGVKAKDAILKKRLEAHECYHMDYAQLKAVFVGASALCHACHSYIHRGRLEILLEKKRIGLKRYRTIMDHGEHLVYTMMFCSKNDPVNLPVNPPMPFVVPYFNIHYPPPTHPSWHPDANWSLILDGASHPSRVLRENHRSTRRKTTRRLTKRARPRRKK